MPKRGVAALATTFMTLLATTLLIALACVSCSAPSAAPAPPATLYQRLGGQDALVALVDDAIGNASVDARINQRFSPGAIPQLKKHLVDLLCVRTGGPCRYTGRNMADVHEGMYIRSDEFDALAEDMVKSIDKFKVPPREKGELLALIAQMKNSIIDH